jgi:hypothetical protein
MATSFSGEGSWREPPTTSKQLVNFITCGCESTAPFLAHLAKGNVSFCHHLAIFQKSTNQKQELPVANMFVNGSGRNEHSL